MIAMLCAIASLVCILWQQRYIQLQNEEIQRLREILSLRDEQLGLYENINSINTNIIISGKDTFVNENGFKGQHSHSD